MTLYPENFPVPLIILEETDSTNRYLTELCNQRTEITELTTVSTERQTAGKGQRGNSWESEESKNLTFSIVFHPIFLEARRQFLISQIVSLSIKEELDKWTDNISIKWPNDIYWKDKKICGILIENNLSGQYIEQSIAGIGVNINQDIFLSNAPNPVSLKQITGQEHDRFQLLACIMERVKEYYSLLQHSISENNLSTITERYSDSLFRKDGFHYYVDTECRFLARLLRVEPDGQFILEDQTGRERGYLFKEVQYVL